MNEVTKKTKRIFTPEQKYEILKDIERCSSVKEGLNKHHMSSSLYSKCYKCQPT